MTTSRQISMVKGEERFIFKYKKGQEAELIDCFHEMAEDKKTSFDWYDATVLSFQLGRKLEAQI